MKTKITILGLIVLLAVSGCATAPKTQTADDPAMVTVTDSAGRTLSLPKNPDHIAALYAVSGHMVSMLDRGDHIVAVNNGLKRDVLLNELVPTIGDAVMAVSSGQINMETLLDQSIDVALISMSIYHDDKQTEQLDKFGIPYFVVDFQNMTEEKEIVTMLGKLLDAEAEAEAYTTFYDRIIALVETQLETLSEEEKVRVYHSINEANCTVASDTLPADWMKVAGGINVSLGADLEKDGDKYYTNLEEIILWNPAVIYCNESGVPNYILTNPQWQFIDAVKNQDVKQMPIGISRWGHKTSIETPLAILWVANDLYPDRFVDVDLQGEVHQFYDTLFEFNLTEDMYQAIMRGETMRLPKNYEEGQL
ncbi:ABC transporter substrate-binding protein [Fusibacter paucivorans]|uniref:ABC transporter substrate-binding protein n=1 Tax=Fusibacter paucivorans TaxID=76009 RepID=A0ABS5PM81_9FIRM|nr:ABC transporter substrate-binding protein [Fusibacter paucivorans]MBS7526285.1 ABC transporter substrate-binding protein [Fusibacter paucivorans]